MTVTAAGVTGVGAAKAPAARARKVKMAAEYCILACLRLVEEVFEDVFEEVFWWK